MVVVYRKGGALLLESIIIIINVMFLSFSLLLATPNVPELPPRLRLSTGIEFGPCNNEGGLLLRA